MSGERPLRVLVVDDDPTVRLLCRINLEAEGFQVDEAADGIEGIEKCRTDPPDVLILDVMMPSISGWEVAARVTSNTGGSELPIIFLTALTTEHARERAAFYGGTLLPKPFEPLELPGIVRRAAARAE